MAAAFSAVGTAVVSKNAAVTPALAGSVGDMMILLALGESGNAGTNTITTPAGWTQFATTTTPTTTYGGKAYAYSRVRQAGDSAPSVNTTTVNKGVAAVIVAYSGAASVEAALDAKDDDFANLTVAYLRPTTLGASRLVVNVFFNFGLASADASTPTAGHTERLDTYVDDGSNSMFSNIAIDDIAQASAGQPAAGNRTYGDDVECCQIAFALVPSVSDTLMAQALL